MALGRTHWNVTDAVARKSNVAAQRFKCSWNTYEGHGLPPALGEHKTVDFWDLGGRGDSLGEHKGDALVAWLLGQHTIEPLKILIWWSWVWLPGVGWKPYSGFQGNHGPGPDAHVHVGFR